MRSPAGIFVVALCLLVPGAARAEDPTLAGTAPVPLEMLKGQKLLLDPGNCSVDAPVGFEWLSAPGMTEKHPEVRMFLCRDSKQTNIFMLQVYDKVFAPLDEKGMAEFVNGAQGSMEQQGWQFQSKEWKPVKLPVEGSSFRFSVKLLRKDNQTLYWIGYVATAKNMYCLSSMQLEDGERPEFNSFVKSFRLLKPVSTGPRIGQLFPYVALSMVVGTVVVFVQSKRQKKKDGDKKGGDAKGADKKGADEDAAEADESDETDAFKPKPIIPSKGKTRRDEPPREKARAAASPPPRTKGETRRDERPRADEDSKQRRDRDRRPDEDSKPRRERDRRPDEDSKPRPRPDEDSRQRRERDRRPDEDSKPRRERDGRRPDERRPDEKSDRDRERPRREERPERPFG